MATKKTTKPGRPARKYIAVTAYMAFEPDTKLKDMMSDAMVLANECDSWGSVAKVTVKKSDGPYPKKKAKAAVKSAVAKKNAPANKSGNVKKSKRSSLGVPRRCP